MQIINLFFHLFLNEVLNIFFLYNFAQARIKDTKTQLTI